MSSYFTRTERISIQRGKLVRIITAHGFGKKFKDKSLDVCKIYEDGRTFIRNIDYRSIAGWMIDWPGEMIDHGYGYKYKAELEKWVKVNHDMNSLSCTYPSESDKEKVISVYPDFKYIFAKAQITCDNLFKALEIWKSYPKDFELLLAAGFESIAFNKSFYVIRNKKPYLKWMKANLDQAPTNPQFKEIKRAMQLNVRIVTIRRMDNKNAESFFGGKVPEEVYNFIEKKNADPNIYMDYLWLARALDKDLNDPYWLFPKDVKKAHDKLEKQKRLVDEAKEAAELAEKQSKYKRIIEKFKGKKFITKGKDTIEVFVPENVSEFAHHASVLHQCLVTCNYAAQVIDKKCYLVFITKNNQPYATAEILRKGKNLKLNQFYGDERNRNDYKAKPDAVAAFNEWAKKFKIKLAA